MSDPTTEIVQVILRGDDAPRRPMSAEAINTLHGACADHPWGRDRPELDRARDAFCAILGRDVDPFMQLKLERRLAALQG